MNKLIIDTQAINLAKPNTQRIMLLVMAALLPGTAAYAYFISPIVLVNIAVAIICALLLELLAIYLRKGHERGYGIATIQDGSIAAAAYLFALAIPPALPFWQLLIGIAIMVLLGKHVFGGLGHNPFNPAMVGYAALMVSFPQTMTLWFAPGELHTLGVMNLIESKLSISHSTNNSSVLWDGLTQATPLEHIRSLRLQSIVLDSTDINNRTVQSGWIWINLGFLAGGVLLLLKNIIQWHIPTSVILSFVVLTLVFGDNSMPTHHAAFSGALILGAFFIATDPVTAASSKRGRLIFGCGVGSLTFVIRQYGGYPEGIAFAILLMNLCVPLIDYFDMQRKPS